MQARADRWEVSNGQVPTPVILLCISQVIGTAFFFLSRLIVSCLSQSLSQSLSFFTHKHTQN